MRPVILLNILSLFNEKTTQVIAGKLAERHTNVINALERIIPTILHRFASRLQEGPGTADPLLQLAIEANDYWWPKVLDWIGDDERAQKGHEMLQVLFGTHRIDDIGDAIAQKTQVRTSSAVRLMQWAAPMCLATMGKKAIQNNYDASDIAALLAKESIEVDRDGIAGSQQTTVFATEMEYNSYSPPELRKRRAVVAWPLLLLLGLLALVLWLFKEDMSHTAPLNKAVVQGIHASALQPVPDHTLADDSTLTFSYSEKALQKLPNGMELALAPNSAEALLLTRIQQAMQHGLDTGEENKHTGWVDLYDVQFTEGTEYRDGATKQMANVAAILKAYPSVAIKIGGYTDNTGPDEVNAYISRQRAEKVKEDLSQMGIAKQIVEAQGFGAQHPIGDNNTREGRALNRRVSCRIVAIN
jgi:Outer membrane protein and related peptidoglycan-associated (lipo)proteins